jgi:hypothetical protein
MSSKKGSEAVTGRSTRANSKNGTSRDSSTHGPDGSSDNLVRSLLIDMVNGEIDRVYLNPALDWLHWQSLILGVISGALLQVFSFLSSPMVICMGWSSFWVLVLIVE